MGYTQMYDARTDSYFTAYESETTASGVSWDNYGEYLADIIPVLENPSKSEQEKDIIVAETVQKWIDIDVIEAVPKAALQNEAEDDFYLSPLDPDLEQQSLIPDGMVDYDMLEPMQELILMANADELQLPGAGGVSNDFDLISMLPILDELVRGDYGQAVVDALVIFIPLIVGALFGGPIGAFAGAIMGFLFSQLVLGGSGKAAVYIRGRLIGYASDFTGKEARGAGSSRVTLRDIKEETFGVPKIGFGLKPTG